MAITTDSYITLNNTDKIGLSDTLDNYSIDDIKACGYVGAYDPLRTNCRTAKKRSMWSGMEEQKTPFNPEFTGSPYPWSHKVYAGDGTYTGAVFVAVVWLYRTIPGLSARVINESNIEDYKLITEMPANKMYYTVPPLSSWNNQVCATSWSEERTYPSSYYAPDTGTLDYHSNYGNAGDVSVQVDDIYPYMMFEYDGYLYFQLMSQEYTYYASWMINSETPSDWDITPYGSSALTPFTEDSDISLSTSYNAISRSGEANSLNGCDFNTIVPYDGSSVWAGPANSNEVYAGTIDSTGKYLSYYCYGGAGAYYATFRCFATLATKADSLLFFGNTGVKIIADKPYKPIITDGIVTGITDDMTAPSELDGWNMGSTDHGIDPSGPPTPPPGPYDDDPWNGVSFSGVTVGGIGAFARCYYMTSTELQNLRSWMGSTSVPEGFDPMAQIIGLSQVPVPLSGDAPENIQFINSSAVYDPGVTSRVVDSGVASQYAMGAPIKYSLGSININRRMQERGEPYLDYSCQVELYLPLVGVFSLDTQAVMGRTISAEAILDPVSGTLAAYAWVEKDGQRLPVAYGSTSIGVDLPVTAQQYSVARAALKQANAQLGTSLLSSALTMIAAATSSGNAAARGGQSISSGANNAIAGNAYAQSASIAASQTMLSQTGNVFGSFMEWGRAVRQLSYGNNTAISGSFGGSTAQWSYPFEAYVKIIRPRYEKPDNYNHSQGVPCVQAKKIGSCTGFLQCINVDVSGITRATDLERQAIQAALCNGVYAGGGQ